MNSWLWFSVLFLTGALFMIVLLLVMGGQP